MSPQYPAHMAVNVLNQKVTNNDSRKIFDPIDYEGMNVHLTLNKGKSICIQLQINVK